jgi:hypothetical protein
VQTRIVSGARALVATYGGFTYLGPLLRVPTLSFYEAERTMPIHLEVIRRTMPSAGSGDPPPAIGTRAVEQSFRSASPNVVLLSTGLVVDDHKEWRTNEHVHAIVTSASLSTSFRTKLVFAGFAGRHSLKYVSPRRSREAVPEAARAPLRHGSSQSPAQVGCVPVEFAAHKRDPVLELVADLAHVRSEQKLLACSRRTPQRPLGQPRPAPHVELAGEGRGERARVHGRRQQGGGVRKEEEGFGNSKRTSRDYSVGMPRFISSVCGIAYCTDPTDADACSE